MVRRPNIIVLERAFLSRVQCQSESYSLNFHRVQNALFQLKATIFGSLHRAYVLTVALAFVLRIQACSRPPHCPAVLRLLTMELLKVIAESLFEIIQTKPLSHDHAADSSTMMISNRYISKGHL